MHRLRLATLVGVLSACTSTDDAPVAKSETKAAPTPEPEAAPKASPSPSGSGLAGRVASVRERLEDTASSWGTYQGDLARTGKAGSAKAIATPRVRWQANVGIQGYLNAPLVLRNLVLVPSSGTVHNSPDAKDGLHAVELDTGAPRWHAASMRDANGATLAGDLVVFTSDDGRVRGLEISSGEDRWSVQRLGAVYSTPLALETRVIVGDAAGNVFAIEVETGKLAWERGYTGAIRGGLASDGKRVFVVSQGGDVAAIDRDGNELWRRSVTHPSWDGRGTESIEGYNAPVVDGERLIVPFARDTHYDSGPALLALSTATGDEIWRATPEHVSDSWGNLRSSPALSGGVLVWAEPYSGDVVALDATSGKVMYRKTIGDCLFPQYASPAIAGDLAYVPRQDGRLYAVEVTTGSKRWAFDLRDAKHAGPVAPGVTPGSGCEWEAPSGFPLYAPPAIAEDGTLFIGSGEGILYALEETR